MKILIGLSGGVDSTISAYLLKKQCHKVIGVTMSVCKHTTSGIVNNSNINKLINYIGSNIERIYTITQLLNIPLYIIDCTNEYKNIVLKYLINEYKNGNTPNPCIQCNKYIKFNLLQILVKKLDICFDKFATGHYANIRFNKYTTTYNLTTAFDKSKDQTYFLYKLTNKELSKSIFPLSNFTKSIVKQLYNNLRFPNKDQKESQDLCFGKTKDILKCLPIRYGNIINIHGKIIGKHNGIYNYTIGQRKNLGILKQQGPLQKPLYVINILPKQNIIVVGNKIHLYSSCCMVKNISWHIPVLIKKNLYLKVKIRSQHITAKATVMPYDQTTAKIEFNDKQMSITKGQSAVFYSENFIIGGGIIT
jgi:tRNA-specific 2-thiouridylase